MFLSPIQILKELDLPSRARVGDFGAGSGEYSRVIAERLGKDATLYLIDAFAPNLDGARRAVQKHGAAAYALAGEADAHIPLRDNLLNVGIVANSLHQMQDKERFVSELARVMEEGGKALVVDWVGSFKNMGPPEGSIMTPAEAARLFQKSGFTTSEMIPAGTHHFAFIATNHTP